MTIEVVHPDIHSRVPKLPKVETPIQSFYKNQSVFLTGGTGFLGKAIIEKLLRSCDINNIYVLIRSKKGKEVESRLDELFQDVFFERLRTDRPDFQKKIIGVIGDCMQPELGINAADRETLKSNVNIVIHAAATIRFDEKLKLALSINVVGTREILQLSKELKNLKAVVHVSTAYANCNRPDIDEKFYTTSLSSDNAIKLGDCLDEKQMDAITPELIKEYPNTYTYTKALAEDFVKNNSKGLPIAVYRPAIVITTAREPVAGWTDNMYGPTGVVVGCGAGLLRVFYIRQENFAELVPVDMVVNSILACAWDVGTNHYDEPPIFNYVTDENNKITWEQYCRISIKHGDKFPIRKVLWYYRFHMVSSKFWLILLTFLYHTMPALLVDTGLFLIGKKPKMMQIYRKMHKFCEVIYYFTHGRWVFTSSNTKKLWKKLSPEDKELFFFDMAQLSWNDLLHVGIYGVRTFVLKEDPKGIPEAITLRRRLKWLHFATVYLLYALIGFLFYLAISKFFF